MIPGAFCSTRMGPTNSLGSSCGGLSAFDVRNITHGSPTFLDYDFYALRTLQMPEPIIGERKRVLLASEKKLQNSKQLYITVDIYAFLNNGRGYARPRGATRVRLLDLTGREGVAPRGVVVRSHAHC